MQKPTLKHKVYDLAGVGIGPFNLGLAALSFKLKNFNSIFLDEKEAFNWHPGMLLEHATLQVPFYADLVTLADPCSPFSYLNFLKAQNRLFKFAIRDDNYVFRIEYNEYCKWVAERLSNVRFNNRINSIEFDKKRNCFILSVSNHTKYAASKIVLGTGMQPFVPKSINIDKHKNVIHSAAYLFNKAAFLKQKSIMVIGSGQSAAEIFYDLLQSWHCNNKQLTWYTRSDRLFQMDTSPFCCELSTPGYIKYFYNIPSLKKESILNQQANLYKGVNNMLLKQIYDALYIKMLTQQDGSIQIRSSCALRSIQHIRNVNSVELYNEQTGSSFTDNAGFIILATGYTHKIPVLYTP